MNKILYVSLFTLFLISAVLLFSGCLNSIAKSQFGFDVNEKDPANCEKMTETAVRNTCYNVVAVNTQNLSVCENIEMGQQKDICFSGVATKLRDVSICEKISDSSIKDSCINNIN